MEPIRFVHTSDWSLAPPYGFAPGDVADKLRKLQQKAIEAFIEQLIQDEEVPHFLFITGDLFSEPTPSLDSVGWLRTLFLRLRDRKVQVCVLRGRTDPKDPSWAEGTGVRLFQEEAREEVGPCTIHALPPQEARQGENLLRHLVGTEETEFLLYEGHLLDDGHREAECHPFRAEDLARLPYKYVALGGRPSVQVFREAQGTCAAYAGSPFATSFSRGHLGNRFFIRGCIAQDSVQVDPLRLGVPEFGAVDLDCTGRAPEELLGQLEKECRSVSILRVVLEGTPSLRTFSFQDTIRKALSRVVWLDLETHFKGIDLGEDGHALVKRFLQSLETQGGLDDPTRQVALELGVKALLGSKDG